MRTFVFAFLLFFSLAPMALAAKSPVGNESTSPFTNPTVETTPPVAQGPNVTLINPLQGGGSLESFLNNILAFVIRIGTIIVVLMVVFVGYKFVAAQGKEEAIREARQMLLWTVVGALILLGAQAIAIAIKATVGALSTGG
ncbi:MAG: TrbC/VirB2 family protein [bacterium]|nr:TrbC/VirB2 family protein [bacterium]